MGPIRQLILEERMVMVLDCRQMPMVRQLLEMLRKAEESLALMR